MEPRNTEARESAQQAGLRYVSDSLAGIRRIRSGTGFKYRRPDGRSLRDPYELARIRALAIPPAWEDVWICPLENGHLQASGRDARGRKQYRYHRRWRATRDEAKYDRLFQFGQALPRIRRRVKRDLARPGLTREKIVATVVRLLETTLIRIGNEEYMRQNGSFGLTTMQTNHVDIYGSVIRFEFRGKSGVSHSIDVHDPRLARVVRQCRDLPGQELFQYVAEDGARHSIDSADVNEYLRVITRQDFTSKDFRTWAGTVLAARALRRNEDFRSQAQAKRNINRAIESVAERLGNTKAVCRKCYIHPVVLEAYLNRSLARTHHHRSAASRSSGLALEECRLMALLEKRPRRARPKRLTGTVRRVRAA